MNAVKQAKLMDLEDNERQMVRSFGHKDDDWVWCLHCERYYQVKNMRFEYAVINGRFSTELLCAYKDCDGNFMDIFRKWKGQGSPVVGKVYPLYPKK